MLYRHLKTDKLYTVIDAYVSNQTNEQAGQVMVLYKRNNDEQVFVRESDEFHSKFERCF